MSNPRSKTTSPTSFCGKRRKLDKDASNEVNAPNAYTDAKKDEIIREYICSTLKIKVPKEFALSDLSDYFVQNSEVKAALENNLRRRNPYSKHSATMRELIYKHALMFSLAAAMELSKILKGPQKSSVKDACKASIKILPYVDEENMIDHLRLYKNILEKFHEVTSDQIPIQLSIDGTAVTGKISTRQVPDTSSDYRVVYGLNLDSHTLPVMNLESNPDKVELITRSTTPPLVVLINGLTAVKG